MASTAGGLATTASSNPGIRSRVFHRGLSPNKIPLPLIRGAIKRMRCAPSPTVSWLDLVISQRTRSGDLDVVVGLFVYAWCECGVRVRDWCVSVHEQMLQLYLDERCKKRNILHHKDILDYYQFKIPPTYKMVQSSETVC